MDQGVRRTSELIGMGCAGIIIGWLGIVGALFVDAVTFLASGLLLSFLQVNEEKRKNVRFQIQGYAGTLKEGVVYFKKSDLAVMVCVICVVQNLCTLPLENLQAAYISEYLRLDVFAMSVGGTADGDFINRGIHFYRKVERGMEDRKRIIWFYSFHPPPKKIVRHFTISFQKQFKLPSY